MADVASFLDRLADCTARLETMPRSGPEAEAVEPLRRSLIRTAARVRAGVQPGASKFRYQVTHGKALMLQGTEALPLEPTPLLHLLNTIRLELQPGEVLDLDGALAAWVIRPEANFIESNLRSADTSVRTLGQKTGRDRDHVAYQSAETTKVRLRSRLTLLVSALQIAATETPPPLPDPIAATGPAPKASAPTAPAAPSNPLTPTAPPPKPKEYPVTAEVLALALEKTLAAIRATGLKAAGIGAIAHLAWGSQKPAQRIELLLSSTRSQRDTLLSALRAEGLQQVPDGRPLQHRYVDEERHAAAPVDLSEASTPPLKQLLARSQTGIVYDLELLVASSEDLILQRIGSDLPEDVEYAVEILHDNLTLIDAVYLKKEAHAAGLLEKLKAAWEQAKQQLAEP